MPSFPNKPSIYEINTRVWLTALSRRYHRTITLSTIPDEALDDIQANNCNGVWMMGAWQRSPAARRSALNYVHEYRPALPNMTDADVSGSPYAIYRYEVDHEMGGRRGMASLRERLAKRGMSLMLDFVPNHMSTDCPWIADYPELFVQGTPGDYRRDNFGMLKTKDAWGRSIYVCRGRDPYFPAWIDTAQLNAFNPELREHVIDTILEIADQCDGIRCDMAMLMTNRVFEQTWSHYVRDMPDEEYWREIIPAVKDHYPEFVFSAEVYWDMEYELQEQGFDFTYDKRLYDRVLEGDPEKIRIHLLSDIEFQRKMVRFLENHDEPRAADTLGIKRQVPAAALTFTLPGAMLLFDGQLTGSIVKLPVQLGRAPDEPVNDGLRLFYRKLFEDLKHPIYTDGEWRLLELMPAWGEFPTSYNLIAHGWRNPATSEYRLTVVNMSDDYAQGIVKLDAWPGITDHEWEIVDVVSDEVYERNGAELSSDGLYVLLGGNGFHVFRFDAIAPPEPETDDNDAFDEVQAVRPQEPAPPVTKKRRGRSRKTQQSRGQSNGNHR
ncbi:MAG: alpha-amylase family glycosyl hydrolase [Chloroflexota bacterium]